MRLFILYFIISIEYRDHKNVTVFHRRLFQVFPKSAIMNMKFVVWSPNTLTSWVPLETMNSHRTPWNSVKYSELPWNYFEVVWRLWSLIMVPIHIFCTEFMTVSRNLLRSLMKSYINSSEVFPELQYEIFSRSLWRFVKSHEVLSLRPWRSFYAIFLSDYSPLMKWLIRVTFQNISKPLQIACGLYSDGINVTIKITIMTMIIIMKRKVVVSFGVNCGCVVDYNDIHICIVSIIKKEGKKNGEQKWNENCIEWEAK